MQQFSKTGGEKYRKNIVILVGFLEKKNIFLDDIGHSFETSGWIFFTITNNMRQILSRNYVLKKKVALKKRHSRIC